MSYNKKEELPDPRRRLENFHKRWSIELSEKERWEGFRSRILNGYSSELGYYILENLQSEDEFFNLMGLHIRQARGMYDIELLDKKLIESPTYIFLLEEKDIRKFILGLEVIFWMETVEWKSKLVFLEDIRNAIVTTGVPLAVKETDDEILFYPAGAKLLDDKLVSDNLDWLNEYPDSYNTFKIALSEVGNKGKERQVFDNLRLSLELLLSSVLNNNKSLENQKADLGKYLKSKNTSTEISNLFWTVLDYFSKYQNEKVKHADNAKVDEVEFILYITGTLIRFISTKENVL